MNQTFWTHISFEFDCEEEFGPYLWSWRLISLILTFLFSFFCFLSKWFVSGGFVIELRQKLVKNAKNADFREKCCGSGNFDVYGMSHNTAAEKSRVTRFSAKIIWLFWQIYSENLVLYLKFSLVLLSLWPHGPLDFFSHGLESSIIFTRKVNSWM